MIKAGLVSVTFRSLAPEIIIVMAAKAGLSGIEWGGDVHVPHGDFRTAERVSDITVAAGLEIAAYGSYYRLGESEDAGLSFEEVLKTAEHLKAPVIRVWAGSTGSAKATPLDWEKVSSDGSRIADMADERNIKVALECHGDTLTDCLEAAEKLLELANHDNLYMYWQPYNGESADVNIKTLETLLPRVLNAHVFHWWPTWKERHLLEEGRFEWLKYLKVLASDKKDKYAMLEFVKDDSSESFFEDAKILNLFLESVNE